MSIIHWTDNDAGYLDWRQNNPEGYVANINKGTNTQQPVRYLKIHRAKHNLSDRSNPSSINPWTGNKYAKVTSDALDELLGWLKSKGFDINTDHYCLTCGLGGEVHQAQGESLPLDNPVDGLAAAEKSIPRGSTLSKSQRETVLKILHRIARNCGYKVNEERLTHGLYFEMPGQRSLRWIGSVYWSDNNVGNDIEIAIDLPRFAISDGELRRIDFWFKSAINEFSNLPARSHSGDKLDWLRAGFRFDTAVMFLEELLRQTDPLLLEASRWGVRQKVNSEKLQSNDGIASLPEQQSIEHMFCMAKQAYEQSGRQSVRTAKAKHLLFGSDEDFAAHILELFKRQQHRCAISGIALQLHGSFTDDELLASLDRIDSDGNYAPGNLQLVCRFVNRWKSDDSDSNFRRLIGLIKATT